MNRRSNLKAWVVISIVLMAFVSPAAGMTIYVDDDGPADYNNIQAAINDANDDDTIIVAKGTFNENINIGGKNITIISTDPNDPNIVRDTIIQGDGTISVVTFSGSEDVRCTLSGFAITGGYKYQKAGGIEGNYTKATISHCIIYGNRTTHSAGGISRCDGLIRDCTITNNSSQKTGGISYCKATITNCNISNNKGDGLHSCYGPINYSTISKNSGHGLLYCYGEIDHCVISGNTKLGLGGCSGPIRHCVIRENTYWLGGGIKSCGLIDSCAIVGNKGVWGGGLSECDFISNCVIVGNSAASGGGVFCSEVSSKIINCTVSNNRAIDDGGGICCIGNDALIDNCIISDNTATRGDEIALIENVIIPIGDSIYYIPSTASVSYCNAEDGPDEVFVDSNCTLIWDYGNINNEPCFINPGYWDPNNTPSNKDDDFWVDGDYHLKSQVGRWDPNSEMWVRDYVSSPCIDAGNPGCPLGEEPAPNGNRINMGAYGGTAEASKSPANGRNIADLTNDWAVDSNDLKVFVSYWLETGECIPSDLDRSRSVDFNDYSIFALQWLYKEDSVAIFVDSNTYSNLTSEIQRLKSDIINDLEVNVFIVSGNWGNIKEIKDILIDKYNHKGLIGAIFIGEIPTAYFEYQNSGSNPTDRYFQDLSDKFIDVDGDGKFEREYYMWETDVMMREIWTARIKPPVGHSEGIELLREYLDRNHNYRTGNLTYDKKMLYYGSVSINQGGMSQDDYNDLVNQIDDYTGLYDSDDDVDSIYDTDLEMQKRNYLTALMNSYDFVFVNIHGTVWHQWLGELNPGDQLVVHYNEIKEFRPQPFFSVLASCSNGDFTTENYFAGWYLFSGNSLVVQANSTVAMLIGTSYVQFLKDYIPLGLGVTFGDMDKNDRNFLVSHIFGDPTLTLRPKPAGDLPRLSLHTSDIDFGDVERGSTPQQYLSFWNGGTVPLKISYKKAPFSINGEYVPLGYWDVFYYTHPNTGETFRDFEVRPGKCKVVPFYFYPRADGPTGRYTMTILFQTNDPENPYIKIYLSGNAI